MKGIVTVPSKPVKKKRDRTQPVNWSAPEDVHDLAYWKARAEAAEKALAEAVRKLMTYGY